MRTINKEKIITAAGHVVVLKGGESREREISLMSGASVLESLQRLGIRSMAIDVGDNIRVELEAARPDLVFIMLHGKGGEDGEMQELLESMSLPYTGSGVAASATAMDKIKSKLLWQKLGLNTAEYLLLDDETDWQSVIDRLGKTVVKPVSGGSSLGISIAHDAATLQQKYGEAKNYDSEVMAERCIQGREFSMGVLDDQLLPLVELETKRQFVDYKAKYVDPDTQLICPAELSPAKQQEIEELVRAAYESMTCTGLARVDLMQDENEVFYLLELNTIPGMTAHSFVPVSAQRIGIGFDELILHILATELELN